MKEMGSNSVVHKAENVYQSNNEALSRNHSCRGKAISITYSECVSVALVIQNAKRMRSIILSSVAYKALSCFFHTISYAARFVEVRGWGGELFNGKRVF
jgi:hypothetical protein